MYPSVAEVQAAQPVPEPAAQVELLDATWSSSILPMASATTTDSAGDGDVVEDLAHRVGERPAVGLGHEHAVGRVHQRHARGEEDRQRRGSPGTARAAGGRAGGQREQRRPRWRCRSPRPKRTPSGYRCQLLVIEPEAPAEEARFMSPRSSRRCSRLLLVVGARFACRGRCRMMSSSTSRLSTPMMQQERAGDARADDAADLGKAGDVGLDGRRGRERQPDGQREHDGRVPEREEEADAERALALLAAACASCCRSRRCDRRRTRGAGRRCRRACRARRARACEAAKYRSRPQPTTCSPTTAPPKPASRRHSPGENALRTRVTSTSPSFQT